MDIDKKFEELYEGWKKGKYTIKDKNGKILGTYSSGGKAQKAMDDLMQKGDYDKLEVSIVEEKEWHDGHEPQGGHDHHEEEEVEEGWNPIEEAFWKVNIPDMPPVFIEAGSASEIKSDMRKKLKGEVFKELGVERVSKTEMIKKYRSLAKGGDDKDFDTAEARTYLDRADDRKKKKKGITPQSQKKSRWGSSGYGKGEEVEEGYKDLPPHLQKLIKKIEKKQKDWNKQNPGAKIQTLVYNPETGKPDIIVKETMKLEDTVKQVVMGEHKGDKPHKHPHEDEVKKEDSDKDEPGTQGDMAAYQKKRKAIAKKFGVKSCSELDGADKKACYAALDKAHVADHEEQVELENMKKEEVSEAFWKVNIPDMPPVFIEAGSSSEIKKDMRKKLKPDVFKELVVERVTRSEMIKKYREMVKGDSGEEEPKEKEEETSISKMYGHVQNLMKGN